MEAKVDQDLCVECGLCIEICPDVFEEGENGKARAKMDPVPEKAEESCRSAVEQCPVECISVEE